MPDTRGWVDANGVTWRLCDLCDAPFKDGDQFWAVTREGSEFESLEYCKECAAYFIEDWTMKMNGLHRENHENCWCGDAS